MRNTVARLRPVSAMSRRRSMSAPESRAAITALRLEVRGSASRSGKRDPYGRRRPARTYAGAMATFEPGDLGADFMADPNPYDASTRGQGPVRGIRGAGGA